jgi:hypothetical protein
LEENMKRTTLILLITALLLGLAGCSGGGAAVTGSGDGLDEQALDVLNLNSSDSDDEEDDSFGRWNDWGMREAPDFNNLTIIPDRNSGEALEIPSMWVTEHGAYFVHTTEPDWESVRTKDDIPKSSTLVYIIDSLTGNEMVLCSRVTCTHDSEDCGAYLPDEPPEPLDPNGWGGFARIMGGFGGGSNLFIDGGYIYALNNGITFYRMGVDGSGRTEHMKLPDKYDFSWSRNWLMNGKLYMLASHMIQSGEFGYTNVPVLLEVDYIGRTVNEIWAADNANSHIDVLGLWSGQLYLMETVYPEWDDTPEAIANYRDNQQITIFSFNPFTGQTTQILKDTSYGFTSNAWDIDESGDIIVHSRRDEQLYRFNVVSGAKTILAENLSGSIWVGEERDGWLLLSREEINDDETHWQFLKRDVLLLNLATNQLTELMLRTRQNVGEPQPMSIQYEEDGYFYVMVEQVLEEQSGWGSTWYNSVRIQLGRIPKADYWLSNADAIEELDWYDEDDWWELLGEKQGWGRTVRGIERTTSSEVVVVEVVR